MRRPTISKITRKLIRTTKSRFFSLSAIVALGMAFFVGVSSSSDLLAYNADRYADDTNMKDITVYADYGFDEEDVQAVNNIEDVTAVETTKFADVQAEGEGVSRIVRIHAWNPDNTINQFILKEGRLPENDHEVLAEKGIDLSANVFSLGSTVTLKRPEDDLSDYLHVDTVTIVGLVETPLYLNDAKETSTLSNQNINTFFYIPESAFSLEQDTEMNILIKDGKSYNSYADAYKDYDAKVREEIGTLGETEAPARLQRIKDDAMQEYNDGLQVYQDGVQELEDKTAEAQQKLDDSQDEINDGYAELNNGISELNDARQQLAEKAEEGKNSLDVAEAKLINGRKQLEAGVKEYEENKAKYSGYITQIDEGIAQLNTQKEALSDTVLPLSTPVMMLAQSDENMQALITQLSLKEDATLQDAVDALNASAQNLDALASSLNDMLTMTKTEALALAQQLSGSAQNLQDMVDGQMLTADTPLSALTAQEGSGVTEESITALGLTADNTVAELITVMNQKAGYLTALSTVLRDAEEENNTVTMTELFGTGLFDETSKAQINALLSQYGMKPEETTVPVFTAALSAQSTQLKLTAEQLQKITLPDSTPLSALVQIGQMTEDSLAQLNLTEQNNTGDLKAAIDAKINELNGQKQQIIDGLAGGAQAIAEGNAELEKGQTQLNIGRQEYYDQINDAQAKIDDVQSEIDENAQKLKDGQKELDEGKKELAEETEKAEKKLADAKAELDDALAKINDLKENKWTVLDRSEHYASASFRGTVDQMKAIADIFPVFFLAVAALVCLTTMTRLVDENRSQTGTLRALGYTPADCARIYLTYAALAALIGIVLGSIIGLATIPVIIYNAWKMMYALPDLSMTMPWKLIFIAGLLFLIVMLGSTEYALHQERKEVPAQLLRPKSPKLGKSVFLEKIPVFWKHLSFTGKVTARNLIRYRQRFIMTVIGVAGCTALLITGFGVRDSVSTMVARQYDVISHYDGTVALKDNASEKQINDVIALLKNNGVNNVLTVKSWRGDISLNDESRTVTIDVFEDNDQAQSAFTMQTRKGKQPIALSDDGIILSEKLSELLGCRAGDTVTVELEDGSTAELRAADITEMYLGHYAFLSKAGYEKLTGKNYAVNSLLLQGVEDEASVSKALEGNEVIDGISFESASKKNYDTMVNSLGIIIWVLIISSMSLAFVVLGNLTNINISERTREIATLKVLGFRKKEVENYIYKENNILVGLGAVLGLPLGTWLHHTIMNQVEMEYIMFGRDIEPLSYGISFVLTIVFGILVNLFMRKRLSNINMVESLKSVE